jgi:acetyl esterase/lipase
MSDRPEVKTASWPIAVVDVAGLTSYLLGAVTRLPFRHPFRGPGQPPRNFAVSATREVIRSLLGFSLSLPIDEFRALEQVLDGIAGQVLVPFVAVQGVKTKPDTVGGVPGLWFLPRGSTGHDEGSASTRSAGSSPGTIIYLHGGGYIGASPRMYALFLADLARVTGCRVFAADYRLAPEFPFPAAVDDIIAVAHELLDGGLPPAQLIIAGDSGGGGLVGAVLHHLRGIAQHRPGAVLLFSPEVSLTHVENSVTENAPLDVLPWNLPVNSYLHGIDPHDERVDVLLDDFSWWPPTYLVYGGDEMFRDAIRLLAAKLDDTAIEHEIREVDGMFHVFPFLLPWARESRDAIRGAGAFVRRVLQEVS